MSRIHGRNLVVLIKNGDWKAVAYATTCELDVNVEMIQVSNNTSGQWVGTKPKRKSWRVTAGHLLSSAQQPVDFKQLIDSNTRIQIAFTTVADHETALQDPPTFTPSYTFNRSGYAYVSRETVTARNRDFVTSSVEFTGDGELFNDLHEVSDFNADFNADFNNQI